MSTRTRKVPSLHTANLFTVWSQGGPDTGPDEGRGADVGDGCLCLHSLLDSYPHLWSIPQCPVWPLSKLTRLSRSCKPSMSSGCRCSDQSNISKHSAASSPTSTGREPLIIEWNDFQFLSSCINPIIYGFMSRNFRQSFSEALCQCKAKQEFHISNKRLIKGIFIRLWKIMSNRKC